MSKLLSGSICYTDLREALKNGHPAGQKAANGKIYVNINVWVHDEEDKYGNVASIQLNRPKDSDADRPYIGNLKEFQRQEPEPVKPGDIDDDDSSLPF